MPKFIEIFSFISFPSKSCKLILEIIKYHSLIHYPFIMHNFNLLISIITLIQIYHFPISVEGDVGQLVKIPSKIGKGILNKANSFSFGGEYASKIKNGILKKANSFGGALNVKNGILDKANSFGKSLSFRKNNENEEKLEMIFKDLATFQDFVMFTVNSINGRPFLLKKYLNFHSNYHFETLFEKIYKLSENKDEKKKNEELENILNESLDMEHLSMEEAMEWKIQFIDWEEKFRKFPFWFELRQKLIYKYRDENLMVKIYEGLIQSKVEKHDFKYPPEILIHLMKGEQDFDQILWDIKNSAAIIEEQIKLWKEKVEPFFDDFEKITNETVKEKWELLKEMNDAISFDLRFNVNKHLRQTEMNMEIQKERIEKKYQNYLDEMKEMAMKVKVRKAEQKKQSQFYHDMGILSF